MTTSYKVEVQADSSESWASNGLRFETAFEAQMYGADLFSRWTAVREYRVAPTDDPVTAKVIQNEGKFWTLEHINQGDSK